MILQNEIFIDAWLDELNQKSVAAEVAFSQGKQTIPSRFEQKKFLLNMIEANQIESFGLIEAPIFWGYSSEGKEECQVYTRQADVIGLDHSNENWKTLFILGWWEIPIMDILDWDGKVIGRHDKREYLIKMFTSEKIIRLK